MMKTILFQGDSITDAGHSLDVDNPSAYGMGYPNLLASYLTYSDPENTVYNCGISGNRVVDLYARWKKDCINLKPDVLTILIGVNDVWHDFYERPNGVEPEKFETVYRMLLEETLQKLPGIRIILMGAYLLHGTSTDENWDVFSADVKVRRDITKKLASEFDLEYIDLQSAFERELEKNPAHCFSVDGVHPSPAGHELIKREWIKVYEK